jgi:hypothetical protein
MSISHLSWRNAMSFFPLSVVAHPEFIPFQSMYVQVKPGCEECTFRVICMKPTEIEAAIFYPSNIVPDPASGLIEDITGYYSQMISDGRSDKNTTDCEIKVGMLTPHTAYRYSVRTYDDTNGYARVVGTFVTAQREVSVGTDRLVIWKAGDPSGTGNLLIRLGLFDAIPKAKEVSYATRPADGGYVLVPDGTLIDGSEFSEIKASDLSSYVHVVIHAKDEDFSDPDNLAAQLIDDWFGSGGGLHQGGEGKHGYGPDEEANVVNSAQGDDEGEWVRVVKSFPFLPKYPGTYQFELKMDNSNGGVEFSYEGTLIVKVTLPTWQRTTQFEWPEGTNILVPRWAYLERSGEASLHLERGRLLLRIGRWGDVHLGKRIRADQNHWKILPGPEADTLLACPNGADTATLAATSANGNLMLAQGTLGSSDALPDLHWVSTDEKCASPVMPVNDGNRLIALMFVGHDQNVRLLPLNEEFDSKSAPKSISIGRQNATKVWPVYEGAV